MDKPRQIIWQLHLKSPPNIVHGMFATDKGREMFWAEKSAEKNGRVELRFIDGLILKPKILRNEPPKRFLFEYFGGSKVTVDFLDDGAGGTDLTLQAEGASSDQEWPGWVSVLLALKAATDYNVDLRNHDVKRTWDQGYCDN